MMGFFAFSVIFSSEISATTNFLIPISSSDTIKSIDNKIKSLKDSISSIKNNQDYFKEGKFDINKLKNNENKFAEYNNFKNELNAYESLAKHPTGSKSGDWLLEKGWVDTAGTANFVGHIADGLFWPMAVVAAIQFIGGFVDDEGKVTSALSSASFGGIMAGKSV